MREEFALALRSDAGNAVQFGPALPFLPPPAMPGDGESMRLVADVLQKMQRAAARRQRQIALPRNENALEARLAGPALGDSQQARVRDLQFLHYADGAVKLADPAGDDEHIGKRRIALISRDALLRPLAPGTPSIASPQRLLHGGKIVSRCDALLC